MFYDEVERPRRAPGARAVTNENHSRLTRRAPGARAGATGKGMGRRAANVSLVGRNNKESALILGMGL